MTFQSYMKQPLEKHNVLKWEPLRPIGPKMSMRYCEEGGLTAYAELHFVAAYPKGPAKILFCPKF